MEPVEWIHGMVVLDGGRHPGASRHVRRGPASNFYECLEGRFGIRAVAPSARVADARGSPGVFLRCGLAAAPCSAGVAALVCTSAASKATAVVAATEATLATLTAGALGAVDLGVGVTQ